MNVTAQAKCKCTDKLFLRQWQRLPSDSNKEPVTLRFDDVNQEHQKFLLDGAKDSTWMHCSNECVLKGKSE